MEDYTYISNRGSQSGLARTLPVVTPLSWQEIRVNVVATLFIHVTPSDHSCYLLYWSFYQIKFNLFGPKGAFYYILLNITLGKTVPHYKFGVKFSPKILKHLILVNASISLTDNVLLL